MEAQQQGRILAEELLYVAWNNIISAYKDTPEKEIQRTSTKMPQFTQPNNAEGISFIYNGNS